MAYVCRDTADGMVLRSRFWIGQGTGLPSDALRAAIPDALGLGLLQHSHTEFKYFALLAVALPGRAGRRRGRRPALVGRLS